MRRDAAGMVLLEARHHGNKRPTHAGKRNMYRNHAFALYRGIARGAAQSRILGNSDPESPRSRPGTIPLPVAANRSYTIAKRE